MRPSWMRLFWLTVVLAGAIAGYLVSSGLGTRLLHDEIEVQLTRLLEGPVGIGSVEVRFNDGLQVEARDVSAYPNPVESEPPVLRARRIVAWVDLVSLLIGRLELSTLMLEGPHVRLVQSLDGSFAGLPIPAPRIYADEGSEDRSPAEQIFARIAELDLKADATVARFQAADRIEIVDGTLEWIGRPSSKYGEAARSLRVELLTGQAERHWLSKDIAFDFRGVFIDRVHAPFPFEIGIHRKDGSHFAWSLGLSKIPLDAVAGPLTSLKEIAGLTGTLDARFRLHTADDGLHHLSMDGQIDDATIALSRSQTILEHEKVKIGAELVIDPDEVRLVSSRIAGSNLEIQFQGALGRPIRPASLLRIESRTKGIDLERFREYVRSIEDQSSTALTIARLTDRVVSGNVQYIKISGTAPLKRWQTLTAGQAEKLPEGFVLGGAFDSVNLEAGPDDPIDALEGEVEWIGDQIVFRNGHARYRGNSLPEINVILNGVSHLVRTKPEERALKLSPPALPGLDPFFEILRPRDPDALPPVKAIGLAIDELEHPIFRWPFRDLNVLIEPLRRGVEVTVRDGTWGGARVSGEVVWFDDRSAPSVSATLNLIEPEPLERGIAAHEQPERLLDSESARAVGRWGSGRFEMSFRPRRFLPFEKATGFFRLEETKLFLDELELTVKEQGTTAARMGLNFDAETSVGFDVSFALSGGRFAQIGPFVALPSDLARGGIDATGSLTGRVRPNENFIADLKGKVRAEAVTGKVKSSLPLMFRLAKATEGYNPFANENELQFESMDGTFVIDRGTISVEDFEIEGPLRVFARADIVTTDTPATIDAVVGIFLFRQPNAILESLPLVRSFLPGSERGLIGTYFDVKGPIGEPDIEALPLQTLMSNVPDVIKAPFKVLRTLFDGRPDDS